MSTARIVADLRAAAKKGDRVALTRGLDAMRMLAHSPRYWDKYLALLGNPLAHLVDLLVIRQGERIARQKTWHRPRKSAPPASEGSSRQRRGPGPRAKRAATRATAPGSQPPLFE